MSNQDASRLPQVGDRVTIHDTGAFGTVAAVVGSGETQRFLVDIQPEALEKDLHALGLPEVTAPERHSYRLEQLSVRGEER